MDSATLNSMSRDRLASRQLDELIGMTRGIAADGQINASEAEFLQKWLVANYDLSAQPLVHVLYERVRSVLQDGVLTEEEGRDLLSTLDTFSRRDFEIGEDLKPSNLPLCDPAPNLTFEAMRYCFTGTFQYGQRKHCEEAVVARGGFCGPIAKKTNVLVIGAYVTDSWKHSSFGNKILQACEWRQSDVPIAIVCEEHWVRHL